MKRFIICVLCAIMLTACSSSKSNNANETSNAETTTSEQETIAKKEQTTTQNDFYIKQEIETYKKMYGNCDNYSNCDLTYEDIMRKPGDHLGKRVKFKCSIMQVIEGRHDEEGQTCGEYLMMDDDYNVLHTIVYFDVADIDYELLENDELSIFGVYTDTYTYITTNDTKNTIPDISVYAISDSVAITDKTNYSTIAKSGQYVCLENCQIEK